MIAHFSSLTGIRCLTLIVGACGHRPRISPLKAGQSLRQVHAHIARRRGTMLVHAWCCGRLPKPNALGATRIGRPRIRSLRMPAVRIDQYFTTGDYARHGEMQMRSRTATRVAGRPNHIASVDNIALFDVDPIQVAVNGAQGSCTRRRTGGRKSRDVIPRWPRRRMAQSAPAAGVHTPRSKWPARRQESRSSIARFVRCNARYAAGARVPVDTRTGRTIS
jgi:hypothetical protein